ncbi:MAG: hypothetical protein J6S44_05045, partial [Clostridia bacterium]|nr:hypothetical protein [Clostridia bacterium]
MIQGKLPSYTMPHCKNASGYYCKENMDLLYLFIGSDGTLAILTELEIGLLPRPKKIWGVTCFFDTESDAVKYTKVLKEKEGGIAAVEYFDSYALDILRRQRAESQAFARLPHIKDTYGCAIYTELHCDTDEEIYALLSDLNESCNKAGGNSENTWVACNESDLNLLHFFRHAVPESVNMLVERYKREYPEITKIGGDLAVPDESFEKLLEVYDSTLKKEGLAHEAASLCADLRDLLSIKGLKNVRLLNRYDVENVDEALFRSTVATVFSEPQLDNVSETLPEGDFAAVFAVEYLPGQFDQRADSAAQCIQIISCGERPDVRTAKVYLFEGALSAEDIAAIKKYVINPVECREASLDTVATLATEYAIPTEVETLDGFITMDEAALAAFVKEKGLAMDMADALFLQSYFRDTERRDPP